MILKNQIPVVLVAFLICIACFSFDANATDSNEAEYSKFREMMHGFSSSGINISDHSVKVRKL